MFGLLQPGCVSSINDEFALSAWLIWPFRRIFVLITQKCSFRIKIWHKIVSWNAVIIGLVEFLIVKFNYLRSYDCDKTPQRVYFLAMVPNSKQFTRCFNFSRRNLCNVRLSLDALHTNLLRLHKYFLKLNIQVKLISIRTWKSIQLWIIGCITIYLNFYVNLFSSE